MSETKRSLRLSIFILAGILLAGVIFVVALVTIFMPVRTKSIPSAQTATGISTLPAAEIIDAKGAPMRLVPAGDFIMGSDDEMARDAQPAHRVSLPDFYMDVYEVTRARYMECVDAGVCSDHLNVPDLESYFKESNFPMSSLDWEQAKTFCEWRGARLPSEAEWEKAARGTDGRTYPWGEEYDPAYFQADAGGSHEVGIYEKGKSPYGMYDMAGNGWEWTADPLTVYPGNQGDHSYYRETDRVLRGGSWDHPDRTVVSTWYRFASNMADNSGYVGFRCAKDAP